MSLKAKGRFTWRSLINPDWERKYAVNVNRLQRVKKYGITVIQYEALFHAQGGDCAICHKPLVMWHPSTQIDHCHSTGKVRGILCGVCNKGLGYFNDSSERLERAVAYLKGKSHGHAKP